MKRREFITFLGSTALGWPFSAHAQNETIPRQNETVPSHSDANQADDNAVGTVATLVGSATVMRGNAAAVALKVTDSIFKNDALKTDSDSFLGITFSDQTSFTLSANTQITVDEFVYQEGGNANAANFSVVVGTAAFVANLVAKTGDMKITTQIATLGIRGTTGIVEVPVDNGTRTTARAPTIKLYPDPDGHVGRIEVSDRQGKKLGTLREGENGLAIRLDPSGKITTEPFNIPRQEMLRDRATVQRLFDSHVAGQKMITQRNQLRAPDRQRLENKKRLDEQQQRGRPGRDRPKDGSNTPRKPNSSGQKQGTNSHVEKSKTHSAKDHVDTQKARASKKPVETPKSSSPKRPAVLPTIRKPKP